MFRIVFTTLSGGEREMVVPTNSAREAVMTAVTRRDFGFVSTCTEVDTIEDLAVQDRRLRSSPFAA